MSIDSHRRSSAALLLAGLSVVALTSSCSANGPHARTTLSATPVDSTLRLPDRNAGFDYQLGGAHAPPPGATIIERDSTDEPSRAGYDICYVNGFQTQPADSEAFKKQHPDLLVQAGGKPVVDPGWPDEYIYDTSSAAKRSALAAIVEPWIDGCRSAGYSAVEIDNLDSYTRARGSLSADDNIAMATEYARTAHQAGLAIAQKNTAEEADRLRKVGFDFAITESCFKYRDCTSYTEQYPVVLDVEYVDELGINAFASACRSPTRPPVMIMRDHNLVTPEEEDYFYQSCHF